MGRCCRYDVGNKRLREESVHAVYTVSRTWGGMQWRCCKIDEHTERRAPLSGKQTRDDGTAQWDETDTGGQDDELAIGDEAERVAEEERSLAPPAEISSRSVRCSIKTNKGKIRSVGRRVRQLPGETWDWGGIDLASSSTHWTPQKLRSRRCRRKTHLSQGD